MTRSQSASVAAVKANQKVSNDTVSQCSVRLAHPCLGGYQRYKKSQSATVLGIRTSSNILVDHDVDGTESVDGILDDGSAVFNALDACNSLASSCGTAEYITSAQCSKTGASMLTSCDLVDNCSSGVLGHVVDDDLGAEASVH